MADEETTSVLRRELEALLIQENECCQVRDVNPERLLRYAHDDTDLGIARDISQRLEELHAVQVRAPMRTIRHIVIASIRRTHMSEGDFPEVMGHMSRLRSYLSEAEQLELLALLVGPSGAADESIWPGLARQLEQNEAIARVFVWLPPKSRDSRDSAREFLDRVFLKDSPQDEHARDLAPLEAVLLRGELSPTERVRWRTTLANPRLSARERASSLLEALADCEETDNGT